MSLEQKQTSNQQLFTATNITAVFLIMLLTSVLNFVFFWFGSNYGKQQVIMLPPMNVPNVSEGAVGEGALAPVVPNVVPNKNEVEEALEKNEEFRKIHSFLQRENPVEFKIPELPKR
jgi:hypothetical protein